MLSRFTCQSVVLIVCAVVGVMRAADLPRVRTVKSFDADWRFLKDDAQGAEQASFNDSAWRKLDVPHDWSIEGPYAQNNPTRAGGWLPAGIGWYRKTFTLPATAANQRVFIEFDGVMANSDVWINGFQLGHRPFGYSSFRYEMTGHLNFGDGKTNVLAVRADNAQQPASRFYAGAGIYRHVRMIITDPVHVDQWGTFITTPKVSTDEATIHVSAVIVNQSSSAQSVRVEPWIYGPDGNPLPTNFETQTKQIPAGQSITVEQDVILRNPKLWNPDQPNMYQALVKVVSGTKAIDDELTPFGIRTIEFKTESGFWINGKNMKLLGMCTHSDGGAFGMAVPMGVWERRLNALRELGTNAIRCAHNPPDSAFLDLCDRMGFLVMDETFDCWTVGKSTYDYHLYFNEWNLIDTRDLVKRDRNHPSIVLYSTGNEIHDTPKESLALSLLKPMVDEIHKWDPTRPVTQALFRPNVSHDYTNGLADLLDVVGTNYRDPELLQAWRDKPGRKIVGTEQQQGLDTWMNLRNNPQHSGQFIWAGVDYLGESQWPETTYYNGVIDRLGQFKPVSYERQSWWATKPMVKITRTDPAGARGRGAARGLDDAESGQQGAPPPGARGGRGAPPLPGTNGGRGGPVANWTPRDGAAPGPTNITIYSNCEEVELFVNNNSLGSKPRPQNDSARVWNGVAFETGTIRAVGKNKGQVVATDEMKSAGAPVKLVLSADQKSVTPTFDDVVFVTASIVDDKGVMNPYAGNRISFKVSGPGVVAVVDNADRFDHDPYQASERNAYEGRAVAVIKANAGSGAITVEASANGLQGSSVTIQTAASR